MRSGGRSWLALPRLEELCELRIRRDSIMNLATAANESRLRCGNAHTRYLSDLTQVVSAHVVQDKGPRLALVQGREVRANALHRAPQDRVSRGLRRGAGVGKHLRVQCSEDSPFGPPATNVFIDGVSGDGARPGVERALS